MSAHSVQTLYACVTHIDSDARQLEGRLLLFPIGRDVPEELVVALVPLDRVQHLALKVVQALKGRALAHVLVTGDAQVDQADAVCA